VQNKTDIAEQKSDFSNDKKSAPSRVSKSQLRLPTISKSAIRKHFDDNRRQIESSAVGNNTKLFGYIDKDRYLEVFVRFGNSLGFLLFRCKRSDCAQSLNNWSLYLFSNGPKSLYGYHLRELLEYDCVVVGDGLSLTLLVDILKAKYHNELFEWFCQAHEVDDCEDSVLEIQIDDIVDHIPLPRELRELLNHPVAKLLRESQMSNILINAEDKTVHFDYYPTDERKAENRLNYLISERLANQKKKENVQYEASVCNEEKEKNDNDDDDTLKSRRLDDLCEHECNT
jgi:hypothetical protein